MALRTTNIEVKVENAAKALAFDLRLATTDWVRSRIRQKIDTAEDSGVDKRTAVQRFCLNYAGAAKASRLARAVPVALVRWSAYVEYNATMPGFPAAPARSVGTFSKEVLLALPSDIVMIKLGGIEFVGVLPGGKPEDLMEIRVGVDPDAPGKYIATLISGRPDDREGFDQPEPVEPELADA